MPEDVEDMKAGRVVVSETRAGDSCIWYYEDGLLKNQVCEAGDREAGHAWVPWQGNLSHRPFPQDVPKLMR